MSRDSEGWSEEWLAERLAKQGKTAPFPQIKSAPEFSAAVKVEKPSKYRNKRVTYGGAVFDSIGEKNRYIELEQLQSAGVISDLRRQVPFVVIPPLVMDGKHVQATVYRADFTYKENGIEVTEDFKGIRTADYILKRKLMYYVHGIVIKETGR